MRVKRSIVFALSLAIGLIIFVFVVGNLQQPIFAQVKPSQKVSISNTTTTTSKQ
jgi:hypothetical protein